ncbi:MAG: MmgE/PrpD family protein [Deltaproteobacteria bacterium]|nr:MAG: MmgE/PrpD family protein [Deltaproteobacteria bacterium]
MKVIDELSQYLEASRSAGLPPEVARKGKHHIVDAFAAMVSGAKLKPGRLAIKYGRSQRGKREATVVGTNLMLPATTAALVNGILAHADETDDTHWRSRTHPGCAIVPAAWAMAEKESRDGGALISAVVAGYDVGCRVTQALGAHQLGWHSTHSIGGTFGAAAAASVLAGLDAQQIRWALSYAAQQASGVRSWVADSDHVEKAFDFAGMPARNGVTAAVLVQCGFTGMADVFEGEKNFLAAYSTSPDPQKLSDSLGSRYEIMETSIKFFPIGAPIQAAAEALETIRKKHGLQPETVEKVTVRLPKEGADTVNNRVMPDINLQYIMAVMLLDGSLSFEAAHDYRRMKEKKTREMMARIELVGDETLFQPSAPRPATVEVTTRSGETLREHVASSRGTPENPMSDEEVEKKALGLIAPVLGDARSRELIDKTRALESLPTVRDLATLLRKP